jgi:hypothetical protein
VGRVSGTHTFVREYFDIPADRLLLAGVSFGYPDRHDPINGYRTRRAEVVDVVQWVG